MLFVVPLDVSCPGGVGLADLGSANELAVAIRLSRKGCRANDDGLSKKVEHDVPPLLTPSRGKLIRLKIHFVVPSEQVSHPNADLASGVRSR